VATLHNNIYDDGLDGGLKAIADATNLDLHITSQEATSYSEATTDGTYSLGYKADIAVTGPTDGDVSGRKITVSAITGGTVTETDTATHFALVDTDTSTLLVTGSLASSQDVTDLNTFSLAAFDIELPDPSA
jgi:hypothetical protein